jgi:TPR repeat protein
MYLSRPESQANHQEAARWFRAAAEQGVPEAQTDLAVMYYNGDGVTRDYGEAAKWARRAAEAGYSRAQEELAFMLEQGKGVSLDYVSAYTWYSAAASNGRRESAIRMKSLERVMLPEQVRLAKSHASAWIAEHGKPDQARDVNSGSSSLLSDEKR